MSANRALSGPSALKSRRTRSGAALACGAAALLSPLGRLAHPRVVPVRPLSRIGRAARLREARAPARPSSAKTFGAPWTPRLAAHISEIFAGGSASRLSRALGGPLLRAQHPRLVTLSAERISATGHAPSLGMTKANPAPSARAPTATCR